MAYRVSVQAHEFGITDLKVPNFAVSATLELIEIFESEWLERGAARQRR